MVSFTYVYTYLHLSVKDGGSSTVDKFLVSIGITLGIVFVLYCLYISFLPSLRRFLNTEKSRSRRLTEDPKSSKVRKILNKLAIIIMGDYLDQSNPPIRSIGTEFKLKSLDPAQSEYTVNTENDKEAQKGGRIPSSSSALTDNDLGSRRISSYIPYSINHIEGSRNSLNRLPRWTQLVKETNNDLITMTSDRGGTHCDLLPLDAETSTIIEKKRSTKKRSLTSIPRQTLEVEGQTNKLRKPKEGYSSKHTQATMTNLIFKRSDFEDARFKKIDEIGIQDNAPDDTIYETNLEGQDGEASKQERVVTLDDVIREHEISSVSNN